MSRYAVAVRTSVATTGAACWELRAAASDRVRLLEIGITIAAATASTFGLGRPAAIGVTPGGTATGLPEDVGDVAGTGVAATTWGTGPTTPAAFLRRVGFPASIGSGIGWEFGPIGIVIPAGGSLVLWNLSAVSPADVYCVYDE